MIPTAPPAAAPIQWRQQQQQQQQPGLYCTTDPRPVKSLGRRRSDVLGF